jgi:decaprenyl-phosphate phosphoribosyltransferase
MTQQKSTLQTYPPLSVKATRPRLLSYFFALRPKQWTKNLIIFAAPLFGFNLSIQSLLYSLLAFILFCAASSGFYLLNDIADVKADRQHPVKCHRPIASGSVSVPMAIVMAVVLLSGSLLISWLSVKTLGITILSYVILQIAYNLKLKRIPILDILTIALGFILRAFAGAAATGIVLSQWFLLCTAMLALFLGIEKRKAEIRLCEIQGRRTRSVLKYYSLPLLTRMESTVTTCAVMSYALWSTGPTVNGASTPWMLLTLPFVIYGILRYQLISDPQAIVIIDNNDSELGGVTERPDEVLLSDKPILVTVLGWVIMVFAILFLNQQGILH